MSENLKKLRKERPEITTYPEQYRRSMRKIVETARQKYEPYNTLSGMANIEELERKVAEARKEEERLKGQKRLVEEEQKRIVKQIINVMDAKRGDEARDASEYFNLARKFAIIPSAAEIFQELSEAEDSHQKKLRATADELERKLKEVS
jgi:hypothetical protein